MADTQIEQGPVDLDAPQAPQDKPSEATPETPSTETPGEGEEGQAETETEEHAAADDDGDAGDDASETDESADGEQDEAPKRKKKSGTARLKEQLAAARAEAAALRSRATNSEPSQAELEKLIGALPKEDDFKGDFLAYERALTAYELDKRQVTRELKQQSAKATEAQQRAKADAVEAHQERIEEFRAKAPDFDATLKAASNLKASPIVEDLILESDKSAHIVYHLAKNPDRLAKLNAMSEREAAREIGRIEARLSLPQPKRQTSAPAPRRPVSGGTSKSFDPYTTDDMEAYAKWRKA